ncbi:tetratricopeptide repeat protein [Sorangium sp. So ce1335]|uniref:tetratricopeptide repeat protein n=1 Tax=Sorangium sp. So ce1335 TaxID=3133335 RepID=UPI003F62AD0B
MRSFERQLLTFLGAALLAAAPAPALAAGAEEDAKTLFARGRELRGAGDCERAIIAFRSALEIYPEGLGALRNIAECEEALGLYASARRDWWDLRRAALQSTEAKYAGWSEDAEARYRALGSKVGTLTLEVQGAEGRQVRVALDGKPLDPRLLGVELERDLGAHTVELFYGGAAPLTERVELTPGAHRVVSLTVPPPVPARDAPAAPIAPAPRSSSSGLRTGGYVALGIGGAGAVAAAVALAVRAGAVSAVEGGCAPSGDGYVCPPSLQGDYDTGRTASTLFGVFAGVGLVGIGTGVTLLLMSPSSPPAAQGASAAQGAPAPRGALPSAELSLAPWPGGVGSRLRVRF